MNLSLFNNEDKSAEDEGEVTEITLWRLFPDHLGTELSKR